MKCHNGLIAVCFVLVIGFSGCHDSDSSVDETSTVLVYMAADNSLDEDVDYSMEQLEKGAAESAGIVVVYSDRLDEVPKLIQIKPDGTEKVLKTYAEENSASAKTLARVVAETKALFPSTHFDLVLWSHAMGWLPESYDVRRRMNLREGDQFPRTRYFAIDLHPGDDDSGQMMTIPEMAVSLPDHVADCILFDACLMGSVEVMYELRNKCDYFIASPSEVLAEPDYDASGMPYADLLPYLYGDKNDLIEACKIYYDHYAGLQPAVLQSATIVLIDASQLNGLYAATAAILSGRKTTAEQLNVSGFQIYHSSSVPPVFFDLGDFIRAMASDADYLNFQTQLKQTVIYKAATPNFINFSIDPEHFSGLSVYIPLLQWKSNSEFEYYSQLQWTSVYQ